MNEEDLIKRVRQFNRFYVHFFGLYNNKLLESKFSLTEARVFFELGTRKACTSKEIVTALQIDTGYMSRMINKFEKDGFIRRESSPEDGRKQIISLTSKGVAIYNKLNDETDEHIKSIMIKLNSSEREELKNNLDNIEYLLSTKER